MSGFYLFQSIEEGVVLVNFATDTEEGAVANYLSITFVVLPDAAVFISNLDIVACLHSGRILFIDIHALLGDVFF